MKCYKPSQQHPSVPSQTPVSSSSGVRWLPYFFFEKGVLPPQKYVLDLQERALWIGFTLLLQSFSEFLQFVRSKDITHLSSFVFIPMLLLPCIFTLGSFFTLWRALCPGETFLQRKKQRFPYRWRRILLILLLLLAAIGSSMGINTIVMCFQPPRFTNDGTSLDVNAAISLLQGRNPYTASSILDVARRFSISPDWTTPLRRGQFSHRFVYPSSAEIHTVFAQAFRSGAAPEFESTVSYPALAFLTLVPFAFFHYYNVLPLYLLSYILLIIIAWRSAPPAIRPWLLVLAMANIPMWDSIFGGNLDILCCLLIILAWLRRDHHWQSALFLGMAVASKQTGWLFVPFYLVLVWRTISFKEAILRICIMMGPFLFNLPFFVWNPQAWLAGISALIVHPFFPLGIGIISLSNANMLPYLPNWGYWLLEGSVLICALAWYQRWCKQCPEAAIVLAVIPLFFAWRSLPSYFACTAFPLFVLLVANSMQSSQAEMPGATKAI